jgi:hypothetical protein
LVRRRTFIKMSFLDRLRPVRFLDKVPTKRHPEQACWSVKNLSS